MSRRAQKKVSTFTSGSWSLTSTSTFIYDGWNLIAEKTSHPSPVTSYYVWGLDLSGSLQGAGGIGGLLARVKDGSVQQYTYDGNGNVSELLNSDGSIAAHYEYDPYGNTIKADGTLAQDNPFKWSTKYFDSDTGLGYWGYRWYSTQLGRWINRDPLFENGFSNINLPLTTLKAKNIKEEIGLYIFVANNVLNQVDVLGLSSCPATAIAYISQMCKLAKTTATQNFPIQIMLIQSGHECTWGTAPRLVTPTKTYPPDNNYFGVHWQGDLPSRQAAYNPLVWMARYSSPEKSYEAYVSRVNGAGIIYNNDKQFLEDVVNKFGFAIPDSKDPEVIKKAQQNYIEGILNHVSACKKELDECICGASNEKK